MSKDTKLVIMAVILGIAGHVSWWFVGNPIFWAFACMFSSFLVIAGILEWRKIEIPTKTDCGIICIGFIVIHLVGIVAWSIQNLPVN